MRSNTSEILLSCQGLKKSYVLEGSVIQVLSNIDLDIYQGEIVMITGPSGSGKSTLLSILSTILRYDDGELMVLGKNLKQLNEKDVAKLRRESLGIVFQAFYLLPTLTNLENVALTLIAQGCPLKEALDRAEVMLNIVGIGNRSEDYPKHLSGGQQQRVAIARALVHSPKILICDEPTSAVDQMTGNNIMQILRNEVDINDVSILITTHDKRIYRFADRIAKINAGIIQSISTPEDE